MIKILVKFLLGAAATCLLVVAILLGAFQTRWVKENLQNRLLEQAKKQGYTLSIGKVQGDLPFTWTLKDVSLHFNTTDSLKIESLRVRFSILPLVRKQIAMSYCHIDTAELSFQKTKKTIAGLSSLPWAFSCKRVKIDRLLIYEQDSHASLSYTLQGKAYFKKGGKAFSFETTLASSELQLTAHIEGNRKRDTFSGFVKADIKSENALSPFYVVPFDLACLVDASFEGPWDNWKTAMYRKPSQSELPLKVLVKTEVKKLKNFSGSCEVWGSIFPTGETDIHHLALKSDVLCVKGEGSFEKNLSPKNFSCSFLLPHLSYFAPHVAGILSGELSYSSSGLLSTFESEELKIGGATYAVAKGKLQASSVGEGSLSFEAPHETAALELNSLFSFSPDNFLHIKDFSLKVATVHLAGDALLSFIDRTMEGAFFLQSPAIASLAIFLPDVKLQGSLAGQLSFKGQQASFYALSQNLQWNELLSKEMTLKGSATSLLDIPQAHITVEGETTYVNQFLFQHFLFSTDLYQKNWAFDFSTFGVWKDPLEVTLSGSCSFSQDVFDLQFDTLKGNILSKDFFLKKPFSFQLSENAFVMSEFDLKFKEGYFLASLDLNPTVSKIRVKAEHFPIDLFALSTPRFTLHGNSSLDIVLDSSQEGIQGRASLLLEKADILQSGKKVPIQSKGSLLINLDQNILQMHANFKASGAQFFEITASAPIVYNFYPLKIGIDRKKPLFGELTMEGHLEEVFDFINIGSHSTTGLLSSHLLLSHTLNDPHLQGVVDIQNGSYENYFTGMVLQEIYAEGKAEQGNLKLTSIKAKDKEKGQLTGSGILTFAEKLPFTFDFKCEELKILHINWLSGLFSGAVTISGTTEKALAQGDLFLTQAHIEIPDELPLDLPQLPFTYINKPPHISKLNLSPKIDYPFYYDLALHAPKNIFLTGRGLNAELQGNILLKGKNLSLEGEGSLDVLKGTFTFSGKEFTLTQGSLSFVNTPFPHAYLNLSATLSLPEMTVTALLRGPLTAPLLTLHSNPTLPTSSILARILFNKDVSELSAIQAAQLAYSIVSLSGNSGPNVFEMIRKKLGVDRLNISSPSGDSDQFTVQIGKYLTKGVMITLSQGTQTSHVIVDVELKNGFVLQAETQENEQAKFSLKWNKNY